MQSIPSRKDVDELKENWERDPCWDIECTEGFEAYRDELLSFGKEKRAEWSAKERARLEARAEELGCSVALVRHIETLEWRISQLESESDKAAF